MFLIANARFLFLFAQRTAETENDTNINTNVYKHIFRGTQKPFWKATKHFNGNIFMLVFIFLKAYFCFAY